MRIVFLIGIMAAVPAAACAQASCKADGSTRVLSTDIRETSGLARGRTTTSVFWTHNDSGQSPELFAIDETGTLQARVFVEGVDNTDWEDIEAGPCTSGSCLYIADIGDNMAVRRSITVYEVSEPALTTKRVKPLRAIRAQYPDGPQDAEALFRLPDSSMYIVTKGRHGSIRLFRFGDSAANDYTPLILVRELAGHPRNELDRVTAATASPNGRWVAIRTYRTLTLYRATDLLGGGAPAQTISLTGLKEKQGEAIVLEDDGTVFVTSEAENRKDKPVMMRLTCLGGLTE